MRFSKQLLIVVLVVLFVSVVQLAAQTQAPTYSTIILVVSDALGAKDTVYCGLSRQGTYCVDTTGGLQFDVANSGNYVAEYFLPPPPPSGVFDLRFIDSRSSAGTCLDQGIPNNFHNSVVSAATKDTFYLQFKGSGSGGSDYPFHFEWLIPDASMFTAASFKYTTDDGPVTENMLTSSSTDISSTGTDKVRIIVTIGTPDGVKEISNVMPEAFALNQNYPNPFNPSTSVSFSILKASDVTIAVYDMLGRKVSTLASEKVSPGYYSTSWNGMNETGSAVSSGTYYIRMNAKYINEDGTDGEFAAVQKVLLMK